jgi:hypothetical protein
VLLNYRNKKASGPKQRTTHIKKNKNKQDDQNKKQRQGINKVLFHLLLFRWAVPLLSG